MSKCLRVHSESYCRHIPTNRNVWCSYLGLSMTFPAHQRVSYSMRFDFNKILKGRFSRYSPLPSVLSLDLPPTPESYNLFFYPSFVRFSSSRATEHASRLSCSHLLRKMSLRLGVFATSGTSRKGKKVVHTAPAAITEKIRFASPIIGVLSVLCFLR